MTWSAGALPLLLSDGQMQYVYGPDGRAVAQISADGNETYLHHDILGSVRSLTDSNGAVVGTATFTGYGSATRTGAVSSLGYAGEYTDGETGFVYLRARYYDAATGQFLTRDPIEDLTGDPYGYVDGNPIMNTDPTGLFGIPGIDTGYEFEFNPMDGARAAYDTASGLANVVTFGATGSYQDSMSEYYGFDVSANECSGSYKTGKIAGFAAGLIPLGVGASGAAASTPFFGGRLYTAPKGFGGLRAGNWNVALHKGHGIHLQVQRRINGQWVKSWWRFGTHNP
jgi:RHS repeat-associated protein